MKPPERPNEPKLTTERRATVKRNTRRTLSEADRKRTRAALSEPPHAQTFRSAERSAAERRGTPARIAEHGQRPRGPHLAAHVKRSEAEPTSEARRHRHVCCSLHAPTPGKTQNKAQKQRGSGARVGGQEHPPKATNLQASKGGRGGASERAVRGAKTCARARKEPGGERGINFASGEHAGGETGGASRSVRGGAAGVQAAEGGRGARTGARSAVAARLDRKIERARSARALSARMPKRSASRATVPKFWSTA